MLTITDNKGFQMIFTDCRISVQFGAGNYCENKSKEYGFQRGETHVECTNAEVAIIPNDDGEWLTSEAFKDIYGEDICDEVAGWVDADNVAKLIYWCAAYRATK